MKFILMSLIMLPSLAFAKPYPRATLTVQCENGGVYKFKPNGNGYTDRQGNWLWVDLDLEREGGWIVSINNFSNKVRCNQIAPAYRVMIPTRPLPKTRCQNVYVPGGQYPVLGTMVTIESHYECL